MNFHNPYHFVPLQRNSRLGDREITQWRVKPEHVSHGMYVNGTISGRLVCRLETEDPIFIGSERTREATTHRPGIVSNFEFDGRPAIPATSLRGLVSSIAEAASNSAMRVLENRFYSYRKKMSDSLSAIGMVFVVDERYFVLPLTLPIMVRAQDDTSAWEMPVGFKGRENWYPRPRLRVHFGTAQQVRAPAWEFDSFSLQNQRYFGMELDWGRGAISASWDAAKLRVKHGAEHCSEGVLIGQYSKYLEDDPIPWEEVPIGSPDYIKGILRVLGCWPPRQIPSPKPERHAGKYHELFLPCADIVEDVKSLLADSCASKRELGMNWLRPISREALQRFHALADERANATKRDDEFAPYALKGTLRQSGLPAKGQGHLYRLKEGDLVYFRPHDDPKVEAIVEVSLSSIWRDCVNHRDGDKAGEAARTFDFLESGVGDPELVPMNPSRRQITLAEQMFGFVEADPDQARRNRPIDALASRIRFTDARAEERPDRQYYIREVTLKILDSPKPPCPTLYFRTSEAPQAHHIEKSSISPDTHIPQGRKFYLHRQHGDTNCSEPWRSHPLNAAPSMKQHVRIRPVAAQRTFWFALDFDNLTADELGLLVYSLRPSDSFRHKLGLGKPIGLGKVRIDIRGLFQVDRAVRYTADGLLSAERYAAQWVSAQQAGDPPAVSPTLFPREAASKAADLRADWHPFSLRGTVRAHLAAHGGESRLKALERLGETMPTLPVCYPVYSPQQPYDEQKLYKWFTRPNGVQQPSALTPLDECDDLPFLSTDGK